MKEETLMNKLLDGHIKTTETLGKIGEILERHDKVTFPEIKKELLKQSDALYRMESQQNEDMYKFIQEKEVIYKRLKPLEDDFEKRAAFASGVKKKWSDITWDIIKDIVKYLTVLIVGYLLLMWNNLIK